MSNLHVIPLRSINTTYLALIHRQDQPGIVNNEVWMVDSKLTYSFLCGSVMYNQKTCEFFWSVSDLVTQEDKTELEEKIKQMADFLK